MIIKYSINPTMKDKKAEKLVKLNTQWSIDRFDELVKADRHADAIALNEEFNEWIDFRIEGGFEDPHGNLEVFMLS